MKLERKHVDEVIDKDITIASDSKSGYKFTCNPLRGLYTIRNSRDVHFLNLYGKEEVLDWMIDKYNELVNNK